MQTDETTEIFKLEKGIDDFQWDPLSQGYCLAALVDGTINLLDFFQKTVVRVFDRQPQGTEALAWLPHVAGGGVPAEKAASSARAEKAAASCPAAGRQ